MNVWQCKANTFADQIAIKAMWIYHVINLLMGMYTFMCVCIYIYMYKNIDCCPFYFHFALKDKVLYGEFNSTIKFCY